MALKNLSTKFFQLIVSKPNGEGLAGATVRIFNAQGADVTAQIFGVPTGVTDSYGQVLRLVGFVVPVDIYTIQVLADGYDPYTIDTPSTFRGTGIFVAYIQPVTVAVDSYLIGEPGVSYVSALAPVVFSVTASQPKKNERILAYVSHSDGRTSIMEADVDVDGVAQFDIRNRIRLHPLITLVPDGSMSVPDMNISDIVTVNFKTVIGENAVDIGQPAEVRVANVYPPGNENDLSCFVLFPANWIAPMNPMVAFRGCYSDVMVWLPVVSLPGYKLNLHYYDDAGGEVGTGDVIDLSESRFVQRVRIDPDQDPDVVIITMQVFSGTDEATNLLTVLIRG